MKANHLIQSFLRIEFDLISFSAKIYYNMYNVFN